MVGRHCFATAAEASVWLLLQGITKAWSAATEQWRAECQSHTTMLDYTSCMHAGMVPSEGCIDICQISIGGVTSYRNLRIATGHSARTGQQSAEIMLQP